MKKRGLFYLMILGCLGLALGQAGCLSVADSPSPRLYMPQSLSGDKAAQKFTLPAGMIIGVGPVRVPEYLSRPQMVTLGKNNLLKIAEFDRWAESLDFTILRLLNEDLVVMLPDANIMKFIWNTSVPVKYQVSLDVIKMDCDLDHDLLLVVQWGIIDLDSRKMTFTKRSELSLAIKPHNYFGLSEALSAACAQLSSEIAQELAVLAKHR